MKRARIIYNPTSGRELIRKQLPYILERLEKAGYEASAHATTGEGCAKKAAKVAIERKYDLVIAAGGDGTVFEVINGLADQDYRPTFGIIPCGTTNDFATALGIPRDIISVCNILCSNETRPIDIGKAGDKYFINVAAGGTLTEITYEVPSKLKTFFGRLAYYIKGIEKLPFMTTKKVRIEYDDNVFEGDILFFLVCNTNSVGGFENLAVKSRIDDGLFDLIIVEKMNFPKLVGAGIQTLSGKQLKHAKIKYFRAKRIKIDIEKDTPLNLDGEYGGMLPCEFINLTHHFNLLAPKPIEKR
ncbi:diacylglycerol kinase [Mycoplasmatota bacterium]|nr:diacylglycerol kinase [Mycoplasmatota bacterium]